MKSALYLITFALFAVASRAADWLDTPVRITAKEHALETLLKISDSLADEDRFFFEQAYSAIRNGVVVSKAYSSLPVEQREEAFAEHIDGMTPRKIIISGLMLRATQYNERDDWEERLSEAERMARREHMKEHGKEAYRLTLEAIGRYGKKANQSPEPTREGAGLRMKPESRVAHL